MDIVTTMSEKPYMLNMGAGKLANYFGCNKSEVYKAKDIIRNRPRITVPRVLILDIETAPTLAYVYSTQVWKAIVRNDQIIGQWFMLSYACKWLGYETMMSGVLTPSEALDENDLRIVSDLWIILNEADIVICHNGDYFDIPHINTRFVLNNLGPVSFYKQIDTLKVARRQFAFTHNSLDALAQYFGIEGKIKTDMELWKSCLRGDTLALRNMETYNRHDVEILEEVYLHLRPWIKSHPNFGIYMEGDEKKCSHCGSTNLVQDGHFYTHTGKYPTYRCTNCGSMPRDRKSILPKGKQLLISIPGR